MNSLAAISTLYFVEHQTQNEHYLSRYEISQLASNHFADINGRTQVWRKNQLEYPFVVNSGDTDGATNVGDGSVGIGRVGAMGSIETIQQTISHGIIYDDAKPIKQKVVKSQPTQQITTKHSQTIVTATQTTMALETELNWPQRISDSTFLLSDVDSNLIDTGHVTKGESK